MKISKGNYSVREICKILGETRTTFNAHRDIFLEHFNMFFECEFIPKEPGIIVSVLEDAEFDYIKYKEAKKAKTKEKYHNAAIKQQAENAYGSAAQWARNEEEGVLKELNHTLKTGERYFQYEIKDNWTRHPADKIWVHLVNGKQEPLSVKQNEYLEKCFDKFFESQKKEFIEAVQDSNERLTGHEVNFQFKKISQSLYLNAMQMFKDKYHFQPFKVMRIDQEPLTEKDKKILEGKR